jgi:hypothetical protein
MPRLIEPMMASLRRGLPHDDDRYGGSSRRPARSPMSATGRLAVERADELLPWHSDRPGLCRCRRAPRSADLQRCGHVVTP